MSHPDTPTEGPGVISFCAWCATPIPTKGGRSSGNGSPASTDSTGASVSHGICGRCAAEMDVFPVESLMHFDRERFDELPFGIIEVDGDGRIMLYNRREEELAGLQRSQVLGRLFFSEVAPCTGVAEFEGRFRAMVASGKPTREELDFVFQFPGSTQLVSIILSWAPAWNRGFILVRVVG